MDDRRPGIVHWRCRNSRVCLLEGFQLGEPAGETLRWTPRPIRNIRGGRDPAEARDSGIRVKVIAGVTQTGTRGLVVQPLTEPLYL